MDATEIDPFGSAKPTGSSSSNSTASSTITLDSQIRKTTSAYQFFNRAVGSKVREELKESIGIDALTMGDVGKRVAEVSSDLAGMLCLVLVLFSWAMVGNS